MQNQNPSLTCKPDVHLGMLIVQQHVVQGGDGIEQHSIHLRRQQANKVRDTTTVVDHQLPMPGE